MDVRTALTYARTFAPALMLLMDRVSSPGLLVRPRPHRIELGGEFVEGARLQAVLAFAAGSVLACLRASESSKTVLPSALSLRLRLDDRRYGWYVDRRAFGPDLYREGRRAQLTLAKGGTVSAQQHLETCWALARASLAGVAGDDDGLEACDRMVSGALPLAVEDGYLPEESLPSSEAELPDVFGRVLGARDRGSFELAPVMVNWHACVFLLVNPDRTRRAFACIPRPYLESFVEELDEGRLDETIDAYLHSPPRGRILSRRNQALAPGLWDELGPRANLLPLEWDASYKQLRRRLVAHLLQPRFDDTSRLPWWKGWLTAFAQA